MAHKITMLSVHVCVCVCLSYFENFKYLTDFHENFGAL